MVGDIQVVKKNLEPRRLTFESWRLILLLLRLTLEVHTVSFEACVERMLVLKL